MNIEVWSDLVCPWCYIGKRRLEAALQQLDTHIDVIWRSFELDPGAPRHPDIPLDKALAEKYGMSVERARQMMAKMTDTAAKEGLTFNFSIAQGGNTLDAHRLIHFAATQGRQDQMKERLLRAYMTEGRSISDRSELATLAHDVGLSSEDVTTMLATDDFVSQVRRDEARAADIGVRGVPFFLIDDEIAISGAQPTDILKNELERHQSALNGSSASNGTSCTDGTCTKA